MLSDETVKMIPLNAALKTVTEMAVDIGNEWTQLEESLKTENAKLRAALEFIDAWQIPKIWCDREKRMISYGLAYGSNGERDYMRKIASQALSENVETRIKEG